MNEYLTLKTRLYVDTFIRNTGNYFALNCNFILKMKHERLESFIFASSCFGEMYVALDSDKN